MSNDKEIAKDLTVAAVSKMVFQSSKDFNQSIINEIAKAYKTMYKAVRDVDKD